MTTVKDVPKLFPALTSLRTELVRVDCHCYLNVRLGYLNNAIYRHKL